MAQNWLADDGSRAGPPREPAVPPRRQPLVLWSLLVGVTLALRMTRPHIITPAPEHALT
jgi:hypothetical protein